MQFQYAIARTEPRFPGSRADIYAFQTEKEMKDWLVDQLEFFHDIILREEGVSLLARDFQEYHSCVHSYDFDLIPEGADPNEPTEVYFAYDCYKLCDDGHGVVLSVGWKKRKIQKLTLKKLDFLKVY